MPNSLLAFLGALLIVGALGMVYSWKVEADRVPDLEAQIQRHEQRQTADDAVMAQRDEARSKAAKKAQEQRDEIQKAFEGLSDDELLCRLHGIMCAKSAGAGSANGTAGKSAGGMPDTSKAGGHD